NLKERQVSDPGYLQIQYETLQQAQTDLGVAYTAAKNAIDDLKSKLDQNLAQWTGPAQEAYQQVKGDWDRAFAHMHSVLEKAAIHVGSSHDMYSQAERQNVSIWQS